MRAPCRGRTGSLQVEGLARYPLLQRSVVPACAAEESNPDRPVRSQARFPLRQRRSVPPAGVDPARDTSQLATSESNRALPPYQSGPFTGWVAASGRWRTDPLRFPACERLAGFEPAIFGLASRRSDLLSYNRMEPLPGADRGGTPIPRASGRRSEGHRSPKYARRDSNPQPHGPQPCPSTNLRHERKRAATRCRPGPSAVRSRSRSRARRQRCPSWIRTTINDFRGRCPTVRPKGIECGRCDSNAQAARSELARSSSCRHSRVRRLRFERRSSGVRARFFGQLS
jgi:hypothetical protein